MNFADLILHDVPKGSNLSEYAEMIFAEGERVAGIVRNLLSFARYDSANFEQEKMDEIIDMTLSLMKKNLEKDHIKFHLEFDENLPMIHCKKEQIMQVLMNLLTNAKDSLNSKFTSIERSSSTVTSFSSTIYPSIWATRICFPAGKLVSM